MSAKVINDNIHGHMSFPAAAMVIIDTFQFQRLRFLKQTGLCHLVFPTATHTRFQHSLGVGFLAFKFAESLRKQHPDLMDEKDSLCIMLAGLCHDLGHGPFSHLYERFLNSCGIDWHHEVTSIAMFDHLIHMNDLKPTLMREAGIDDTDLIFIKELIAGPLDPVETNPGEDSGAVWPYRGRTEEKSFLYEIVSNKISGIDVDKWDYFLRDDQSMNIGHVFSYERFMNYSSVHLVDTRRHICLRDKEAELLREMYLDRARLHKFGYRHRVVTIIDRMMIDVMMLANDYISIQGADPSKKYKLTDTVKDMSAFEKLGDDAVFFQILYSEDERMGPAKDLLLRIMRRQFYKDVAEINVKLNADCRLCSMTDDQILSELEEFMPQADQVLELQPDELEQQPLQRDELVVLRRCIDMGMGSTNPMSRLYLYTKTGVVVSDHTMDPIPQVRTIWICCKRPQSRAIKEATMAVKLWRAANNL